MGCSRALVKWFLGEVESLERLAAEAAWREARRVRREVRRVRREVRRVRREVRTTRREAADNAAWRALMEPFAG